MQSFEFISEATYPGNLGMMEMYKFKQIASPEHWYLLKKLINQGKKDEAWELIKKITGVKLKNVDESSIRDNMYDEIADKLENAGYTELGSGAESIVWTKDEGSVIKIILPEDETNDQAVNTFKKFIEFCQTNTQYTNLPKIKEITDTGTQFLKKLGLEFVIMERLQPIKNGSFQEAMVWILSDLSANKITWEQAWEQINDERTWENYSEMDPTSILKIIDQLDPKDKLEYEVLFKLMTLLYHKGRINKLGWDLHTENVMQRNDGTLVIIDPWFSINV